MATKKKKIHIAPVQQAAPSVSNAEKAAALTSMLATQGWALIAEVLMENIAYLERTIITGRDPSTGEKLTAYEQDVARDKLELNKALLDTPNQYIRDLLASTTDIQNFDPYHNVALEAAQDRE
jgi:hypothetical protein